MVDWMSSVREICLEKFVREPIVLGGPGTIVQIDESVFGRRKYNRGRLLPTVIILLLMLLL